MAYGLSTRARLVAAAIATVIVSAGDANDARKDQLRLAATGVETEATVVAHEPCRIFGIGWCPGDDDRVQVRFSRGGDRFTVASVRVREMPPLRSRVLIRFDPSDPDRAQLAHDPPSLYWTFPMTAGPMAGLLVAGGLLVHPALVWRAKRLGRRPGPHAVRVRDAGPGAVLARKVAECDCGWRHASVLGRTARRAAQAHAPEKAEPVDAAGG